jgi:multidrug resistance efflux pump
MKHRSRLTLGFALVLSAGMASGVGWLIADALRAAGPVNERASTGSPVADRGIVCFGHVDVEHGVTALAPLTPGRVTEVPVPEGQSVAEGAALIRLDGRPAQARLDKARAVLQGAEARLLQAQRLPDQHRARLAQQQDAVVAAQFRLAAAQQLLARKRELLKAQQVSEREVAAAQDQIEELKAAHHVEEDRLAELSARDPALDVRGAEAEVAAARAGVDEAQQALDECTLRAPADGSVLRVLVGPGDVLDGRPGRSVVVFCAAGPRSIRAEVEHEFVRYLKPGQTALLEDDVNGGRIWHGKVKQVSDWYTRRRSVMNEPLQANDVRTVECVIDPDAGGPALRVGQRLRVVIQP